MKFSSVLSKFVILFPNFLIKLQYPILGRIINFLLSNSPALPLKFLTKMSYNSNNQSCQQLNLVLTIDSVKLTKAVKLSTCTKIFIFVTFFQAKQGEMTNPYHSSSIQENRRLFKQERISTQPTTTRIFGHQRQG